jgi:alkylated DNA repair dioxygenase AlkB
MAVLVGAGFDPHMDLEFALSELLLGDGRAVAMCSLPDHLVPSTESFEAWWALRPAAPPMITVRGWKGPAPRYKQAYEHDYRFSGQTSHAIPLPDEFVAVVAWARSTIDPRLNGILGNWYDASEGHYIGEHRDKDRELISGSPIVTMSFGDPRVFRLKQYRGDLRHDIVATPGLVIVMPWDVNKTWTHEIAKTSKPGRRISLTLRCFA